MQKLLGHGLCQTGWNEQRTLNRKEARSQEIRDAVFLRPAPDVETVEKAGPGISEAVKGDTDELGARSISHTTPPRPPSNEDPLRVRSPPTLTRREQSGKLQESGAFARRQLGGMLRSGPSNRAMRLTGSSASTPSSPSDDKGGRKDQADKEKSEKKMPSAESDARDDESTSSMGEGPTVASSAFLRKAGVSIPSASGSRIHSDVEAETMKAEVSSSCSWNPLYADESIGIDSSSHQYFPHPKDTQVKAGNAGRGSG